MNAILTTSSACVGTLENSAKAAVAAIAKRIMGRDIASLLVV
jgi:hypothetical protein